MENIINEQLAERAKQSYSFFDYEKGSATSTYNDYLKEFNENVQELIENNKKTSYPATAEQMELVEYYRKKYAQKLAYAINRENEIITRCPSIAIAGASNFPVRKKEKQVKALEKHSEQFGELFTPTNNYYFGKIKNILTNKTIYSNDALALEKLENKLKDLEESQEYMKKANIHYRKNKTMKGFEDLTEEQAEKIDSRIKQDYSWNQQPYPTWHLQNNNAEIKRIQSRIEQIKTIKKNAELPMEDKYPKVDGVEVIENAEAMRIQLIFNGKPDEKTRDLLKHNGFKFSPKFTAWQRQLTPNGIYATKQVLKKLQEEQQ